jgi:hypothetical protein
MILQGPVSPVLVYLVQIFASKQLHSMILMAVFMAIASSKHEKKGYCANNDHYNCVVIHEFLF